MCDGGALTIASIAASVTSAAAGMASSYSQNKYQQAQAEQAARQEEFRALQQLEKTRQEQQAFDKQSAQQRGQQATIMAASGLDMSSGALLDLATDTAREQAIDRQNIGYNGRVAADDHLNSASSLRSQASGYGNAANNALIGGALNAGGSIIGQAGGLFDSTPAGTSSTSKAINAGKAVVGSTYTNLALKNANKLFPKR